ncbi:MAG TPA: glycine oxidase ThiO [Rubricoccaceae bacterium]
MPAPTLDVVVVGAGAAGLGVAWRLAQAGVTVVVLDRGPAGRGATWAAAGMLAPSAEIGFEELDLYALGRESLARWPAFAADLQAATGVDVGLRTEGTLVVADDRDSLAALRRLFAFQQQQGVAVEWLSGEAAREAEPLLSPRVPGAVFSPADHQVDNRALAGALVAAVRAAGGEVREGAAVEAVEPDADRPAVRLAGGERLEARAVVLAAGAWSRNVGGLVPVPVRPVKGQMLSLQMTGTSALSVTVRGPRAYLVPKPDGRLVVGATSEDVGDNTAVTAGGLYRLLEGAVAVVPGVEEMDVVETWAGLRPASRDHAPILGRTAAPGVLAATGHYRHGVLLAPVTADEVAAETLAVLAGTAETRPLLAPFSPKRFR